MTNTEPRIITKSAPLEKGRVPESYEILRDIGEGGMAKVVLARQLDNDQLVAIKFPHIEMVDSSKEFFDRFIREVMMASSVSHENVIRILDYGIDQDAQPFMVMEFISGATTLESVIKSAYVEHCDRSSGPVGPVAGSLLPLPTVLGYFRQLLAGLGAIHDAKIIHRDLKPDNVLVTSDGRLVIMDFGIAKNMAPKPSDADLSLGMVFGTPNYLSPEHIRPRYRTRDEPWQVGTYSDLWSAIVILYEMTSGRLPYDHSSIELLMGLIADESDAGKPTPISTYVEGVNPALERLFVVGFNKLPWDRPQTVHDVAKILDEVEVVELDVGPYRASRVTPRRLAVAGLALVAGVFALMGARSLGPADKPVASMAPLHAAPPVPPSAVPDPPAASTSVPAVAATASKRIPGACPTADDARLHRAYTRGIEAAEAGDCRIAELNMTMTLVSHPSCPMPFRILGDCARKRGRVATAQQNYARYLGFEGVPPLTAEASQFVASSEK